jgi:RNA polymerase sigma-70 factor (ECF subfamily)
MSQSNVLAEQFELHRDHLRSVAYRIVGSATDADDAVQETWLRLSRSDIAEIENLGGWLTTVVSRIGLDMLRARGSRREEPLPPQTDTIVTPDPGPDDSAADADAVGVAMLVVLEQLSPPERLAFVLHDMFGVSFAEIGDVLDRTPATARQLASRARRRVQGSEPSGRPDARRHREIVDAFLAAARGGDFEALLRLLDPDVELRADEVAASSGAPALVLGAHSVASTFSGRAKAAVAAVIDGFAGAAWAPGGQPKVLFDFIIDDDVVIAIDMTADPDRIADLRITLDR